MFFNELTMLRLRLRIHSPVVDFFVIRQLPSPPSYLPHSYHQKFKLHSPQFSS